MTIENNSPFPTLSLADDSVAGDSIAEEVFCEDLNGTGQSAYDALFKTFQEKGYSSQSKITGAEIKICISQMAYAWQIIAEQREIINRLKNVFQGLFDESFRLDFGDENRPLVYKQMGQIQHMIGACHAIILKQNTIFSGTSDRLGFSPRSHSIITRGGVVIKIKTDEEKSQDILTRDLFAERQNEGDIKIPNFTIGSDKKNHIEQ